MNFIRWMQRIHRRTVRTKCLECGWVMRARQAFRGKVGFRRIFLLAARSSEGPLTEPTAGVQPARRELAFMPPKQTSVIAMTTCAVE